MKYLGNSFLVVLVIIFFIACKQQKLNNEALEVISVNPLEAEEYINLSEIADSVKCIKLQTDSNNIMG